MMMEVRNYLTPPTGMEIGCFPTATRQELERLNPALPPEVITAAMDELTRDRSTMSMEAGQVELDVERGIQQTGRAVRPA